ncbi:MAG: hypothetical protein DWB56_11385 [Candidatus Jettenia sp.]|uniref:Uncharacterized protein n=1 Tax=Candidatus Jettenia caeni TaxID=247490 RepID=I3IQ32_9BACT|nr:MAG: hypothetical protein EDM77_14525 [Candidatus Jettenia sp. AMX1]MBC6929545.1 hypothetical protein [Candidatus Jettenia sp.]GAB63827.1 hypothetical protein KSU1_D0518 [Candidatus Jettenia caeni]MCE7881168.1 hypothetical protein [Candidatus Jettenia sp. AMX1]MCQ3927908.1 hypothetical protein [Candidatus Jettenia sp.]
METVKNNKPPIIPLSPPLKKGEMVNALEQGEVMNVLEKGEKFDMFDQANFSQEKILPSFPLF